MINVICNQILNQEGFKLDYKWVSLTSAKLFFDSNDIVIREEDMQILLRLLQCATTFAISEEIKYRQLAYEIAVLVKNLVDEIGTRFDIEIEKIVATISLVFSRLGNFPAENKYLSEMEISLDANIPKTLWFERENHYIDNTVNVCNRKKITLTDFQRQLWDAIEGCSVVIVNAPTSAGKSFILQNQIINAILNGTCQNALYIVPTRALIEQVIMEFKEILGNEVKVSDDILITEVPNIETGSQGSIFVLTQERTQLLLEHSVKLDLVVIDEAQNIADSARGVILQSVIEVVQKRNESAKFIFATPYVKNPEIFLSLFHFEQAKYKIIPIGENPVSQNLYNVLIKTSDLSNVEIMKLNDRGVFSPVCNIRSKYELSDERKYLAILPLCIGKNQNNIIYASEPSNCEYIASLIAQDLALKEIPIDSELLEFSEFIKNHIHQDYLLAETIKRGVAYHYGNLPAFIRKGIERLCSNGKIKYIVCTSTLLQGINLPAQNIFIMKPSKGHENQTPIPLNGPDFWNLAGRAGRLTKDFEGNIFLINLDEWDNNPLSDKERKQVVYSSLKKYLCDPKENLCDFIEDRNHKSGDSQFQGLENTFMKLFLSVSEGRIEKILDDMGSALDSEQRNKIMGSIENSLNGITLPYEVYSKNPNVSIYRQEELYRYLKDRISEKGPQYLIPPHPMHTYKNIKSDYLRLFIKLGKYFEKDNSKKYIYYANLALLWMRGESYKDLLESRINHNNSTRKRGQAKVNTEARGLFADIEYALRFKYVKFSKCYNDLLAYVLQELHEEHYVESIPPLHLFLELGASSGTMISLMAMGLSRTSAAQIAPHMISSKMNRKEISEWLKYNNIYALGLPQSVINELEQIV